MFQDLMVILQGKPLPEDYGKTLFDVISSVLMSPHTKLQADVTPKLINLVRFNMVIQWFRSVLKT
jgi:hypothetical protein